VSAGELGPNVAISSDLIAACATEVRRTFPLESGGVLMGRLVGQQAWVVDHIVGPGPKATHAHCRFLPDLPWQHDRIAERFLATDGISTYLGDWHSHPGARHGRLSYTDCKALRCIINAPEASCSSPLMMILWSGDPEWQLSIWNANLARRRFFGIRLSIRPCNVLTHSRA